MIQDDKNDTNWYDDFTKRQKKDLENVYTSGRQKVIFLIILFSKNTSLNLSFFKSLQRLKRKITFLVIAKRWIRGWIPFL